MSLSQHPTSRDEEEAGGWLHEGIRVCVRYDGDGGGVSVERRRKCVLVSFPIAPCQILSDIILRRSISMSDAFHHFLSPDIPLLTARQ